jgi:hypothetical protein
MIIVTIIWRRAFTPLELYILESRDNKIAHKIRKH